jgi:hypothetical protein
LIALLLLPSLLSCGATVQAAAQSTPEVYVGVDVAFQSLPLTLQLIDNVCEFTNFFVIGCHGAYNLTKLTTISQYAYDKGLHFVVYTNLPNYPTAEWLENAERQWGNKFMGIYAYDEAGGRQIDLKEYPSVKTAANYTDAAEKFVHSLNWLLRSNTSFSITHYFKTPDQFPLYTSDYALYWYDYQAGYDTVFAEVGFNSSQKLPIALIRGAATVHNRDWGVIVDWAYTQPPYIESGPKMYEDMVQSYHNGAKYIVVFDSNKDYTQSILEQQHFDAMQQFWQYTQDHSRDAPPVSGRVACVLPDGFGAAFREKYDRLWGVWEIDEAAAEVLFQVNQTLNQYGDKLDFIYPTNASLQSLGYSKIINWTGALLFEARARPPPPSPPPAPAARRVWIYLIVVAVNILVIAAFVSVKMKSKN